MRTIFWNVDTQYDFMNPNGKLAVQDAMGIVGHLEHLTHLARQRGMTVINTADWHNEDSAEISEQPDFITTFPAHCLAETDGAEYISATKPTHPLVLDWRTDYDLTQLNDSLSSHREIVITKDAFDVFTGSPYTEQVLQAVTPERAIVYGVATNVCVDYAVMGLTERGVDVVVPTDAIKELPGLPLEEILQKWQEAGATLTTTAYI